MMIVALTKVKRKGKEHKADIMEEIKTKSQEFSSVYVLSHNNMTTAPFRAIQQEWKGSKFMIGKNKLIQIALGRTPETECADNIHFLSKKLTGSCVLFFTNEKPSTVEDYFRLYEIAEFAKGGEVATEDILLKQGKETLKSFSHAIEPYFRKLGLPTKLDN